jgi:hypothetical protein
VTRRVLAKPFLAVGSVVPFPKARSHRNPTTATGIWTQTWCLLLLETEVTRLLK